MKASASLLEQNELVRVGALPLTTAEDGTLRVLLVTSRDTRRWVIPKGWPMKDRRPYQAAALEALEEAGLIGRAAKEPIGSYTYIKRRDARSDSCRVDVYALEVRKQLTAWREKGQRELQWFTLEEAADVVEEPELAALLLAIKAHWRG
ncbi:MAG: NUDIX hydrolase [Methylobacteriaceae bacterium]|nr:NUDIX hydrolase [Methylobacteriaceae bacterium]